MDFSYLVNLRITKKLPIVKKAQKAIDFCLIVKLCSKLSLNNSFFSVLLCKLIYFQFPPNGAFLYYISDCEYRIYTTFGQRVPMLGRVAQATFSQPQTWIPILAGLQINAGIKNFITQAQQFNTFPQFAFGDHICCNLKKMYTW